jgi:hypothetical protein
VSNPYKPTSKIIILYVPIFTFLRGRWETNILAWLVAIINRTQFSTNFLLIQILFVTVVSKYLNCATISNDLFAIYVMILTCMLVIRQQHMLVLM